jgi:hypothetical protein
MKSYETFAGSGIRLAEVAKRLDNPPLKTARTARAPFFRASSRAHKGWKG